ncbi:VOC family protein [Salegentibacter agarivorans]
MNTKQIWANLAVKDLERTTSFYTNLGFKSNNPRPSKELTSFMVGNNNFVIHFLKESKLKTALNGELANLKKGNEVLFTLAASSVDEVNHWEIEVKNAGGTIVSKPHEFGEGYYGFVFSDPDGHKFNVFYMDGF